MLYTSTRIARKINHTAALTQYSVSNTQRDFYQNPKRQEHGRNRNSGKIPLNLFVGKFYQTGEKKHSIWHKEGRAGRVDGKETEKKAGRADGKEKKSCWKNCLNTFFTPLGSHQNRKKTSSRRSAPDRSTKDDYLHYGSTPTITTGITPITSYQDFSQRWLEQNQRYLDTKASYNDFNQLCQTTETSYENPTIMNQISSSKRYTPFPTHLHLSSPSYNSSSPNLNDPAIYYRTDTLEHFTYHMMS